MRKKRFTEPQIISILKSVESGRLVKDVCREHSIAESTYFNWKSKYGGMEASDIKRMKALYPSPMKNRTMQNLIFENYH